MRVLGGVPKDFLQLCGSLGADPMMTQGMGGNASFKEGGEIYVKASGTLLSEAAEGGIFIRRPYQPSVPFRKRIGEGTPDLERGEGRPSIELPLHLAFPQRYVIHLHQVDVLSHVVREDARSILSDKMAGFSEWGYVDYFRPGIPLGLALVDQINDLSETTVVFLGNHGVVYANDSFRGLLETIQEVSRRLSNPTEDFEQEGLEARDLPIPNYTLCTDPLISSLALSANLLERVETSWALWPDHVVFLGSRPRVSTVGIPDSGRFIDSCPSASPALFVPEVGVYLSDQITPQQEEQLRCYSAVLNRLTPSAPIKTLPQVEVEYLVSWEAEIHRQNNSVESPSTFRHQKFLC